MTNTNLPTLDDAAFLLAHFARSNAAASGMSIVAREARSQAFEDAAYHCRALLAGDPRSLCMLERLRQEAAEQAPAPLATPAPAENVHTCAACVDKMLSPPPTGGPP